MSTKINTILITGASSGIGCSIAEAFMDKGSNPVLKARDDLKLERAAAALGNQERVACVARDVYDPKTGRSMLAVFVRGAVLDVEGGYSRSRTGTKASA